MLSIEKRAIVTIVFAIFLLAVAVYTSQEIDVGKVTFLVLAFIVALALTTNTGPILTSYVYEEGRSWPEHFYARAKALDRDARLILGFAVSLLISGGLVFIFASSITTEDLGKKGTVKARIAEEEETIKNFSDLISTIYKEIGDENDAALKTARSVAVEFKSDHPHQYKNAINQKINFPCCTFSLNGRLIAQAVVDQAKATALDNDQSNISREINFQAAHGVDDLDLSLTPKEWTELASEISKRLPLDEITKVKQGTMAEQIAATQKQIDHLRLVDEGLKKRQIEEEVDIDKTEPQKNLTTERLVQTSITRFGSLAIVSFLVAICIPLYRYNRRLSAFYMAVGDAFKITMLENSKDNNLERLVSMITPPYDFGQEPKTPIDQILEIVKALRNESPK